ncbi:VOC family protein [Candidatus Babeliales bacterium]|nr:VOC family protein [Candidatus Babeliales bacterium]
MVKNVQVSIDYYQNFLKFNVLMKMPEQGKLIWALLQRDNVSIMLQQQESLLEEYPHLTNRILGGSLSLFIKISDLENFDKEISSKVKVIKVPHVTPYGMKEFAIEDPDGYLLVFAEEK